MIPPVTGGVPPLSGRLREKPEDFVVEEVRLYPVSGRGTHVHFLVEKTELSTFEAVQRLARALRRPERDFGYAGLKDRHAVTRQWMSLEHCEEADLLGLALPGLRVMGADRHGNKLRLAHLAGNRFAVRVRGAAEGDAERARQGLAALERRGVPNAFGVQRFGREGASPRMGRALLRGEWDEFLLLLLGPPGPDDPSGLVLARERLAAGDLPGAAEAVPASPDMACRALAAAARRGSAEAGVRALPRRFLNLIVSSVQSEIFNRVLAARIATFDQCLAGDVAWLHRNGACFVVEDAAAAAPRADAFEISPSGPLFGPHTLMGHGEPRRIEAQALEEAGLGPEDFARVPALRQKGARRPLRVRLQDPSVEEEPDGNVLLRFLLPAGAYATVVLDQLFHEGGSQDQAAFRPKGSLLP